ncbi:ExbD/TolR family protein [Sinomicrobium weinanense]|uniref:Biopolymer transporter ExbD n=1 Tax=Sinomicrobium weinanense TaxID=2842200 RepID=A0A926JNS9_9FLAO|nr:biopolymer transporter ExbD [Sinomicrobium weinanense]MBC9794532.1 biopolymer transporter ExbD [Sinomicrobium weinanense]MBU3124439.1 biopolymer transporter ExbD [Sinomicrobium weinanense]
MARRGIPEVNAGSMADIAFLLLIFFLVTTTIETDSGLDRKLPPDEPPEEDVIIKERNLLQVLINKNNQLMVNEELTELKDLRQVAMDFIDNGAGANDKGETCDYCQGAKDSESSVHPEKAIISLQNDRQTKYSTYIAVQNELVAAYNELRNRAAQQLYKTDFTEMQRVYKDPKTTDEEKDKLRPKVERVQKMYPQLLSEAEPKKN